MGGSSMTEIYVWQPSYAKASEMADRAGFEPAVAVTPRTLSKRVP